MDQLFEQNISQSIRQREIILKPVCKMPFTVHRIDEFEHAGLLGFHDHHNMQYYFKQALNLTRTVGTLPSFGCEISTVIHIKASKIFVFFLKDRSLALVESTFNLKLRFKGPEVIVSCSQTKEGDFFAVGVSGAVYLFKVSDLTSSKFEHICKIGLDNWRMIADPLEVENADGYSLFIRSQSLLGRAAVVEWIEADTMLAVGATDFLIYVYLKNMVASSSPRKPTSWYLRTNCTATRE